MKPPITEAGECASRDSWATRPEVASANEVTQPLLAVPEERHRQECLCHKGSSATSGAICVTLRIFGPCSSVHDYAGTIDQALITPSGLSVDRV
jgi:hypothetical protein